MDRLSFNKQLIERVTRLTQLGATIWIEGDRLRYEGPEGALRAEDKAFFSANRVTVVLVLTEGIAARCSDCGQTSRITLDPRRNETGRPDERFSDLWAGECQSCKARFSQAIASAAIASGRPLIVSELVN